MVKGVHDSVYQVLFDNLSRQQVRRVVPRPRTPSDSHRFHAPTAIARPPQPPRRISTSEPAARLQAEGLLDEPPEMDMKRRADMELLAKLRSARRALESLG